MSTPEARTTTTINTTAALASEATRLASETSRRTVDNAKAAVEAARGLLDDQTEATSKLLDAYVAGTEGALKASFELQNAGLAALTPILDAAITSQRSALQQWESAVHQGQHALLDAFQTQVRATTRLSHLTSPKS